MRVIPGDAAYELLRQNRTFRWAQHKPDIPRAPSRAGRTTLIPRLDPKFRMQEGESVFTVGSCFAREIELALQVYGYHFETQDPDNYVTLDECTSRAGFFNKFTTISMLNELRWCTMESETFPDTGFFETGTGRWIDGQLPATFATLERVKEIRQRVSRVFRGGLRADFLILTLGLVECWHDSETNVYLNVAPPAGAIKKYPNRFSVHILDYRTNLAWLEEIYESVKKKNASARFIVTVSPVPLGATFTGMDIATANCYSKSTLRAVAGDFVLSRPDVDYFPSYEMVTESAPNVVWLDDAIHVQREFVRCITASFIKGYGPEKLGNSIDMEAAVAAIREKALAVDQCAAAAPG